MRTSTAYDYDRNFSRAEEERRLEIIRSNNRRQREKRAFAVKLGLMICTMILLMAATVYSRLVLTETRAQINSRTSDLTELQSENAYLSYQLESLVSLKNAEEYAISELGLVKLDSSRIEYVNLQTENEISADEDATTLAEEFKTFFNTVIDSFAG